MRLHYKIKMPYLEQTSFCTFHQMTKVRISFLISQEIYLFFTAYTHTFHPICLIFGRFSLIWWWSNQLINPWQVFIQFPSLSQPFVQECWMWQQKTREKIEIKSWSNVASYLTNSILLWDFLCKTFPTSNHWFHSRSTEISSKKNHDESYIHLTINGESRSKKPQQPDGWIPIFCLTIKNHSLKRKSFSCWSLHESRHCQWIILANKKAASWNLVSAVASYQS